MSLTPPEWISQWSEVVSGLGSIVLSLLLVILYKRQQEQLSANNKALLDVSSVEWDRDKATIELSNYGNGVATNLSLLTLAYVDNGGHRRYVAKSNHLKRQDKSGEWANTIRPEEEDIEFKGKSRIGKMAPDTWPNDWIPTYFSSFIREMRATGSEEVKYLHVVKGAELSNDVCLTTVAPSTRIVNPQNFEQRSSVEDC